MYGQSRLIEQISELVNLNTYPRFSIYVGERGSGKRTLGKELSKIKKVDYIIWGNTVEDIRSLTEYMWQQENETVYCIPNYEEMSNGARNALLKICEEPPNRAYIILTSSSKEIILPTILNRGIVFEMQPYTEDELHAYEKDKYGFDEGHTREQVDSMVKMCRVPGDLDVVRNLDIQSFQDFMRSFWKNIGNCSAGNALKITNKIKVKEDSNAEYPISIFINCLMQLANTEEDIVTRSNLFKEILEAKRNIQLNYNKLYILDNLILRIRGILSGDI